MPDENRNPLEFDAVVRRFAESTEALATVREQLQALAELREVEEKATASLQGSAGQVAEFAAEAARVLKGLEDAQATVAEVLKIGADLLDGTELKGIAESVKVNSQSITAVDNRVDALDSKVAELISTVGTLQTTVEQGLDSLNAQIKDVHAAAIAPKIVKRFF